ncbi:nucleotidyltransferase family protein [Mucilaginibacter corticis]|uniref:Nucleotidyltransferase family protein n=2 Tax=Mucilaginibacter corticis TaxID=2597670 RepID=A0A556M9G8_9SPHI|nr:nucleotidyltransferase family protein [Mucilaginibacter corticis]
MTALVILAAGESSRLKKPKQNLDFKGKTLLELSVEAGLQSDCATIVIILGANAKHIKEFPEVAILYNENWKEGMASSIRLAIGEIDKDNTFDNAIIMVCDQPFVDAGLLNALITKQETTGKAIVACSYNNAIGVPVLFNRSLFPHLLRLSGKDGAKKILKDYAAQVVTIPFDKGAIDIDTVEDYARLLKLNN